MPSAFQNTDAMTFPADGTDLVFLALNNWFLFTALTAVWILVCTHVSSIVINRSTKSVLFLLKGS
jgi:hypothetical protein